MTEKEAVRIINAVIATVEQSKAFKMATDALEREALRDKNKDPEYKCPCCGADVFSHFFDADFARGTMYCPQCNATYEWKRQ